MNNMIKIILSISLLLIPSVSRAVPVSFSFSHYYGPSSNYIVDTKDGVAYNTTEGASGYIDGNIIGNDSSIPPEFQSSYEYDYDGSHYTMDVYDRFGETDINPDANPLYFGFTETSQSNMFSFEPAEDTEVVTGVPAYLGTFTFTNGGWFLADSFFDFKITATSETAGLYDQEFTGTINLVTNSNALETAEARADWFWIENRPDLGSMRVYEPDDGSNSGSVEFWGAFGSLDLVEFRNPTGGAFLSPSTTENPAPVPEPATSALLGIGLLGLAGGRKKFLKK